MMTGAMLRQTLLLDLIVHQFSVVTLMPVCLSRSQIIWCSLFFTLAHLLYDRIAGHHVDVTSRRSNLDWPRHNLDMSEEIVALYSQMTPCFR